MRSLTFNEVERFVQELAGLQRAGIPLPQGLREIASSVESPRLGRLMQDVANNLEKGQNLSQAMQNSSIGTSPEFRALADCIELSGDAGMLLAFAAEHQRRVKKHNTSLMTACLYPLLLIAGVILILVVLSNSVLLQFDDIYSQLGAELPALSQFTMSLVRFFHGFAGALLALLLIAFLVGLALHPPLRERGISFATRLPGFSAIAAYGDTALLSKFLAVMLARGVPLTTALQAAGMTIIHPQTKLALESMSEAADKGQKVGDYLSPQTPATAAYLFRQGEERGNLIEACESIARYCEESFSRLSTRALLLFEPALVALIAILIGFIIVSLYLPLFSIPKIIR